MQGRALARCFFAVSKPQKPGFAVWRKKKKKKKRKILGQKKKICGGFWALLGPLARPPDDWHDSTLIFFCSLRSRKYTLKKFPLASLAELTHIFFACGAIFLFCFEKGLLSVKPASLHRTLIFFACGAIYYFTMSSGRPLQFGQLHFATENAISIRVEGWSAIGEIKSEHSEPACHRGHGGVCDRMVDSKQETGGSMCERRKLCRPCGNTCSRTEAF